MKIYRAKKVSFALLTGAVFFILSASIFGQNMFARSTTLTATAKTDLAIWRDGRYWVFGSQIGARGVNWGIQGDKPIPY